VGDSNHAKDLLNQFVWSFEKYFMRDENDYYILFAPVKYWKSVGLMQKIFINGFLANRGNFKAQESSVLVALWKNDQDTKKTEKKPESIQDHNLNQNSNTSIEKPKKLSYQEERELEKLIKDLELLEEEKEQINRIFDNKDLPYDEIALLSEHLGNIIKQIEQKESRRFELLEKQQ